jgi:hypothetical protein
LNGLQSSRIRKIAESWPGVTPKSRPAPAARDAPSLRRPGHFLSTKEAGNGMGHCIDYGNDHAALIEHPQAFLRQESLQLTIFKLSRDSSFRNAIKAKRIAI